MLSICGFDCANVIMCSAKKCCFCLNVNIGAILFSIGSFIVFAILSATTGIFLVLEDEWISSNTTSPKQLVFGIEFKVISINVMLAAFFVVSMLATLFSVLLLIGIVKNRPGLLLSYFAFGTMNTIMMQLGCLLLMIHSYWYISLVWFVATLVYIHYLVVVHTVYEMMQRGKRFGIISRTETHEELLN